MVIVSRAKTIKKAMKKRSQEKTDTKIKQKCTLQEERKKKNFLIAPYLFLIWGVFIDCVLLCFLVASYWFYHKLN